MAKEHSFILSILFLFLISSASIMDNIYAKEKKPTPEEIVAKHLESIGSPETLSAVKSRTIYGIVDAGMQIGMAPQNLPEPGKRKDPLNFFFASAEHKMGMVMKFYDPWYPGEHLAFDGKDATASITSYNQRSGLGNFITEFSGVMREGLLGGTLSTSWALLHFQDCRFILKYDQIDIDGKKFHQITCTPKNSRYLYDMFVRLFLEFETYRHVMTEYVRMEGRFVIFIERFGNFKSVDGMTLPHSYFIHDPWGRGSDTAASRWSIEVKQISHNEPIDPQLYHAK
jgi:hypothetical protein